MAGGKITPRQKMINMMYLVLTALLALNVSAEILLSFETIADSLRRSAATMDERGKVLQEEIKGYINKEGEKGNHKLDGLITLMDETIKKSDDVSKNLEKHISELYTEAHGGNVNKETSDPSRGILKMENLGEQEKNYGYFMGHGNAENSNDNHGGGEAFKIRNELNAYVEWANKRHAEFLVFNAKDKSNNPVAPKYDVKIFKPLCVDPKDDPGVPGSSPAKSKTWEYYTFHSTPAIANVAMLQKFKNDVKVIESELLELIKSKLQDVPDFKVNKLLAMDAPESQMVVAGFPFRSKIFVVPQLEMEQKPRFNGPGVKVDKDGTTATISINTDGAGLNDKRPSKEVPYSASVTVINNNGAAINLPITGKYTVRKPELVFQGASVANLYQDCCNDVVVDCPALGNLYNPVFSAVGGSATKPDPAKNNKVRCTPNDKKYTLVVKQNTNGQQMEIGRQEFTVIKTPEPDVKLKRGKDEVPPSAKVNSRTSDLFVQVVADKQFATFLPNDAKYKIGGIEIKKRSGIGPVETVKELPASGVDANPAIKVNLATALEKTQNRPGDLVYLKIKGVYRVTCLGQEKLESTLREVDLTRSFVLE